MVHLIVIVWFKHWKHKLCEMSDIISISSSDGNDSSNVEVLPLLPVKLESSEVCTPGVVVNHTVHVTNLDSFLHSKPHTIVKQTKHSVDCSKKCFFVNGPYILRMDCKKCSLCWTIQLIDIRFKWVSQHQE
jgi:hypothetical protein